MSGRLTQLLFALFMMVGLCAVAQADQIGVGDLSFDLTASINQFDITNVTGTNALPPDFPITTPLSISVSSLVVNFTSGPAKTLPGTDFTIVDPQGDLNCTAGECNFFGQSVTSAVLTGTFSPTAGLSGLPAGDSGILAAFTATLTPDAVNCSGTTLEAGCDFTPIFATGTTGVTSPVPEPGTVALFGSGILGLMFLGYKRFRGSNEGHVSTVAL